MPFTLEKPVILFQTVGMDTSSPPQHWTQTYQMPSTYNPTRSLSKNAGLSMSYTNYQIPPPTTFAANLKLHTNSSSNHNIPPDSTSINLLHIPPSSQWHLEFRVSLFYSTAEEGHGVLAKSLHLFSFRFISICLSNAHLRARRHYHLSLVSAALSPLPFLFISLRKNTGCHENMIFHLNTIKLDNFAPLTLCYWNARF